MKRLIVFLSALLSTSAYAENFTATDKVLFFSTDVLIEVIERNFDKNLQLDVANKYIELMDSATHSVSIADLTTICATGQIDSAKCRNFINDLFTTMGIGDTVKPFYWADYVSVDPEPIRLQTYSSGDGYHKNPGLGPGEWAMTFGWMKNSKFIKQYPQTKYIRGASACTADAGTPYTIDAGKNYALNETGGENCWCKMVGPEESPWVYNKSGDTMAGGCERSCALECLSALRAEPMRAAMFSVVKLNGSNVNTSDEKVVGDALIDKFKPCEFDWADVTGCMENPEFWPESSMAYKLSGGYESRYYRYDSNEGLKAGEWRFNGFPWMKTEAFQRRYPKVNQIKGIVKYKPYSQPILFNGDIDHEYTELGACLCKIIYPEQSQWIYCAPFSALDFSMVKHGGFATPEDACLFNFMHSTYGLVLWEVVQSIGKK